MSASTPEELTRTDSQVLLSDEELLDAEADQDGEQAALAEIAGAKPDEAGNAAKPEEKKPQAEAKTDEGKKEEPAKPAESAAQPAQEPVVASAEPVRYRAEVPPDLDKQLSDLAEQEAALQARVDSGELEAKAYGAELKKIVEQRAQLQAAKGNAELLERINIQNAEHAWRQAVRSFVAEAKAAGVDYEGADKDLATDWDGFIRALGANPANADKPADWFLREAHKRTLVLHGRTQTEPKAQANSAAVKTAVEARKPPQPPATLAQVPGGEAQGDVGDEFASLDALQGDEFDAAYARLSAAQKARYLGRGA